MQIERVIAYYRKDSEKLEGDINIDHIDFEKIKNIFNPPIQDYMMYDPYEIGNNESIELKKLDGNLNFDLNSYSYYIECYQI